MTLSITYIIELGGWMSGLDEGSEGESSWPPVSNSESWSKCKRSCGLPWPCENSGSIAKMCSLLTSCFQVEICIEESSSAKSPIGQRCQGSSPSIVRVMKIRFRSFRFPDTSITPWFNSNTNYEGLFVQHVCTAYPGSPHHQEKHQYDPQI